MRFLSALFASFLGTLVALGFIFMLGFLLIIGIALSGDTTPSVRSDTVLKLELSGAFSERTPDDPFTQAFSGRKQIALYDAKRALQKAAVDDRISGIWLKTEGLTDSWSRLNEFRNALIEFKASGKPLIAYAGTDGFSEKDYFVATAADTILAPPESMFEFTGMFIAAQFLSEMLDNIGVEAQYARAGAYKSAVEPFVQRSMSDETRVQLEDLLRENRRVYYEAVSESRGIPVDSLQSLAERTIMRIEDALAAGLIDGLRFEDEILDQARVWTDQRRGDDLRKISLRNYVRVPARQAGLAEGRRGTIAVVYAEGAITSGSSRSDPNPLFGGPVVGSDTFVEAMREARTDDDVSAIVVRINSPGGSITASDAMWREVQLATEEKPVIVSMGNLAASGGYYIAASADTIVAEPLTITGSIGVFAVMLTSRELMEDKIGINFETLRTAPHADMFSGLRPLDEREQALLQQSVDRSYDRFLGRVADGRNMTVEQVHEIAQGRIWMGTQAVQNGLVDVLGDINRAIEIAAERAELEPGTFNVRHLPRERSFFEQISEAFEASARNAWLRFTTSPSERAIMESIARLRQVAEWHGTAQARLPLIFTD